MRVNTYAQSLSHLVEEFRGTFMSGYIRSILDYGDLYDTVCGVSSLQNDRVENFTVRSRPASCGSRIPFAGLASSFGRNRDILCLSFITWSGLCPHLFDSAKPIPTRYCHRRCNYCLFDYCLRHPFDDPSMKVLIEIYNLSDLNIFRHNKIFVATHMGSSHIRS